MSLSSRQLEAFTAIARTGSFTEAAAALRLTQSALSQRILNLEAELETTLFIREPNGVRLTEAGEGLLRYCRAKESLEEEFLGALRSKDPRRLSGRIRVAAFSTFARSVLLPTLGRLARAHPEIQVDLLVRETRELPGLLRSGEADFVFSPQAIDRQDFACLQVGKESNVLIESARDRSRSNVYLDHDEHDTTTADFWKVQKQRPPEYPRAYFDEIYAIIDAVEEGFGRAVVPRHLIEKNPRVRIVPGLRPLDVPVHLLHFKQPFYTRLQQAALDAFKKLTG